MFNVYYILMDVTVTQWHSLAMLARIKAPYDSLNLTRAFYDNMVPCWWQYGAMPTDNIVPSWRQYWYRCITALIEVNTVSCLVVLLSSI